MWGRRFGLLGPLPCLVRLTSLKFERGCLDRSHIAVLARSLGISTHLHRLELPYVNIVPEPVSDVSALSSSLAGLVSLEHLVMGPCIGLSTEDMARMLPSLTALRHLDLQNNHLVSDIAPALAALKALTYLDLYDNDLLGTEEGMVSISSSLALLTGIVYLDLQCNHGHATAATATLGHSLPQSLTYLSVSDNRLGADAILAFVPGLQRLTALRHLSLSNVFSPSDYLVARTGSLHALANCMKRMPGLTSLHLSFNNFGSGCVPTLAGSLQLQNLQLLDLSLNNLGVGGTQQLVACLLRMLKLRELDLSGNSLGDDGFAALIGSMDLPSLVSIAVRANELTGAAIETLAAALRAIGTPQAMPTLVHLDMGCNQLGDGSAEALAFCLQHMPNLKNLHLNNAKFGDTSVATLMAAMQQLDSLIHLDFSMNLLTGAATRVLMSALRRPGREIWAYR